MKPIWSLQDAKNRFSEVLEHAVHEGPQTITRRGKETAVIVSVEAFRDLSGTKGDLVDFLHESPLTSAGLDLTRPRDYGRKVDV